MDLEDEHAVYNNLGHIYRSKEMYEEALEWFNKVMAVDPGVSCALGDGINALSYLCNSNRIHPNSGLNCWWWPAKIGHIVNFLV